MAGGRAVARFGRTNWHERCFAVFYSSVYKEGTFYPSHEPCPLSALRNNRERVIFHAILHRVYAAKPGPSIASKPVLLCNMRSDWNSDATPINYNWKRRWNEVVHQANWKQDDRRVERVCVYVRARTLARVVIHSISQKRSASKSLTIRQQGFGEGVSLEGGRGVGYIARIYPMNHACCSRWYEAGSRAIYVYTRIRF